MAAVIAGWAAEITITKLVKKAFNLFIEQSGGLQLQQKSAVEGLGRLQTRYEQVHEVLARIGNGPVEMDEMDPGLRLWLWQFRDAIEAADILLDDFEHRHLQEQLHAEEGVKVPSIYQPTSKFIKVTASAFGSEPLVEKLAQVVKQLDSVVANTGSFLTLVYNLECRIVRDERRLEMARIRETGSLQTENKIFGRENEIKEIRNWLLDKDFDATSDLGARSNSISVMTMVGIGGVGKTTLVQEIFNDTKVQGFFSETFWVCVSSPFSASKILYEMVEDEYKGNAVYRENLDLLQEAVRNKLTSRRFLLVLDDIWDDENHEVWKSLVTPLQFGKSGSKILVTTRLDSVAAILQNVLGESIHKYYNLKSLEYKYFLSLLNRHAFTGVNINDYRDLQLVAEQIAKKLGGIPLLGKVVGGQLNSWLDFDYWVKVLDSDAMDLQEGDKKVFEILKLSYQNLPTKLHACFRYCSIFPKNYGFEKDELIQMWMAAGLVPDSQVGKNRPEDVGEECFNVLVAKSFLNETQWDSYIMHDSLHNLACSLSKDECWSVQGNDSKSVPQTIRHLSVRIDDLSTLRKIAQPRYLRTLILEFEGSAQELAVVLDKFLNGLTSIRVLILHGPSIDEFPIAIANLVHLRYISFCTECKLSIPNCFNKLYHLQAIYLYMRACRNASDLKVCSQELAKADAFSKLTRLRYFNLFGEKVDCSVSLLPGFGKLTSLQKLEIFNVKNEDGYKLGELKELDDLHYSLQIAGIENVSNHTEATEAFLKNKRFLSSLSFTWNTADPDLEENTWHNSSEVDETTEPEEWNLEEKDKSDEMSSEEIVSLGDFYFEGKTSSGGFDLPEESGHLISDSKEDSRRDEKILNCLKPHSNLKELSLNGYGGQTPPIWLRSEFLSHLISVTLRGCHRIVELPKLEELPFLKSLHLIDLPCITEIGHEIYEEGETIFFPVLEELKMSNMPACREWNVINQGNYLFPGLRSLCISSCPLLKQIPSLPLTITEIELTDVGLNSLPCLRTNQKEDNNSSVLSSSLSSLIICNCPNLISLAEGFLQAQRFMVSLSKVEIRGCERLVSLPTGGFTGLVSLKDLFMEFPPSTSLALLSEEAFPISMERLNIVDQVYVYLPKIFGLSNLSFLELERSDMTVLPVEEEFRKLISLSYLGMYQFRKIKSLGGIYALNFLQDLRIHGCHMLEMLDFEMGGKGLSKLQFLEIQDCKEMLFIQNLYVLGSLKDLNIEKCLKLSSLTFKKSHISKNEKSVTQQPMELDCFEIRDCNELESLEILDSMASVDSASICRCQKLAKKALEQSSSNLTVANSIPRNSSLLVNELSVDDPSPLLLAPLSGLTSIKKLTIQDCSHLNEFPENFLLQNKESMHELLLQGLGDLESLPEVIEELCNLTTLDVQDAMKLQSLPQMPASLKILRIEICNRQLQTKCQRRSGELWPKIAHVPSIKIVH